MDEAPVLSVRSMAYHTLTRSQSLGDLLDRAQQTHRALYRDAALPIGEMSYIDHYQAKDERLRRIRSSHVISEQRRRESIGGYEPSFPMG